MSSSESEDENIKRFLEAADTTLINDEMFKNSCSVCTETTSGSKTNNPPKNINEQPKSNRYLLEEENVFQSDINVSESMKNFVWKKISAIIEQNVTFVEFSPQKKQILKNNSTDRRGIKLLSDSVSYLKSANELENDVLTEQSRQIKSVKRRVLEPDVSTEKDKLSQAIIEPCAIEALAKCWTNRPKAIVYEYQSADSLNVFQEPINEFSKLRRKNGWDESKIAKFGKQVKKK